jgi:type I restriction enzyme M protein
MYARLCEAPFFVTHNNKESRFWRVRKDKVPGYLEEIESIPHANASDKQITAMLERLKVFREDEFADLFYFLFNSAIIMKFKLSGLHHGSNRTRGRVY